VRLYVDLFIERVFGGGPHGVDAWGAGRQLAAYVKRFPELRPELRMRYQTASDGLVRQMFERLFW
jgi:hypothetical protein